MGLFDNLFAKKPFPAAQGKEVNQLISELISIGTKDDYLSEAPGSPFNYQCRHVRARDIGKRLDEIGGQPLMIYAHDRVKKKLGLKLVSHLEYCWADIGEWLP